jgi:hypothetical protein
MNIPKVLIYPKFPVKKEFRDHYSNSILELFDEKLIDSVKEIEFNKTQNYDLKTEAIDEIVYIFDNNESMIKFTIEIFIYIPFLFKTLIYF